MDLRKAAEMALEALELGDDISAEQMSDALDALRQALAQPEQEPVAWQDPQYKTLIEPHKAHPDWIPLYTAPPKREWVGLTDEEGAEIWGDAHDLDWKRTVTPKEIVKRIEAKLKEKNT